MALKKTVVEKTEEEVVVTKEVVGEPIEDVLVEEAEVAEAVEVEANVEAEAVEEVEAKQEVSVRSSSEVAKSPSIKTMDVAAIAASQGFEGIGTDGGSYGMFPVAIIDNGGVFELDGQEREWKSITGRLESTSKLFLCLQKGVSDGPSCFSDDGVNLNGEGLDGCTTVAELKAAWEEEGETLIRKEYLNVTITVTDCEDEDLIEQIVVCRIAPNGVNRFRGLMQMAIRQGTPLSSVVVEFSVGPRSVSKSGEKYFPWAFKRIE